MYSDQDVVEAFAHWWIKIGGTAEAFDELKLSIFKQILIQELGEFGKPIEGPDLETVQANLPPLPPPPPFSQN